MWLKGTVRNVMDIGVQPDGLVHVLELANRVIKNPLDVVRVGEIVDVRLLRVDVASGRIGLGMRKR